MQADLKTAAAWPRPRALLLDAMGTLITLRQSVGHTYAAVAAEHGLTVEATAIDRVFGAIYRQAPPLAFPGLEGAELLAAERQWWGERISTALQQAGGVVAPPELQHALFERFADPALWMVYAEVPDCLARWQTLGIRLAVVSNFDQRLQGLLEGLGLTSWLEVVVVSSSAGAAKPSPLPFRQALHQLQLEPGQAWHVGDSPEDELGAAAAGVRCLRLDRS
ncbi:HAD-IA family hydrolase [Synechococcus sp. CCY9201]|uniref:HAD-IA family hydrolase n=1 Tax=Synechococcus sp. CCY9201 TaxID=174697 RepID=UPI002B21A434|nr:HAD-IA family hydrolase [Synechococcus sp. CCY9201]MEA5472888.1 HAD-IA family hydrolase [Synechococcus sp. CCY9201]